MNGHISAAYAAATGAAPVNGALAAFADLWNAMPRWRCIGRIRGLAGSHGRCFLQLRGV